MPPLALPDSLPGGQVSCSATYIALLGSDGDNLQVNLGVLRQRMTERVAACAAPGARCPPLSWTLSNRMADVAPAVVRWFYAQAAATGRDSFLLGPSGWGYFHPGKVEASHPILDEFLALTLSDLRRLDMNSYIHCKRVAAIGS